MRYLLRKIFDKAFEKNNRNILSLFERNKKHKLLDLGCDDGVWTLKIAERMETDKVFGIDLIKKRARLATKLGVEVEIGDLNGKFPYRGSSFHVLHANQVIEHIGDLDSFVSEMYRILKPGGYAVVSTENGSSWHNIFASIMGWQMFSLTNVSFKKRGVGNPFAAHRNNPVYKASTWTHKTIFNYLGLKEFFELHGFEVEQVLGAGYYPLPAFFGNIDVRHSHFMTFKIRKPSKR